MSDDESFDTLSGIDNVTHGRSSPLLSSGTFANFFQLAANGHHGSHLLDAFALPGGVGSAVGIALPGGVGSAVGIALPGGVGSAGGLALPGGVGSNTGVDASAEEAASTTNFALDRPAHLDRAPWRHMYMVEWNGVDYCTVCNESFTGSHQRWKWRRHIERATGISHAAVLSDPVIMQLIADDDFRKRLRSAANITVPSTTVANFPPTVSPRPSTTSAVTTATNVSATTATTLTSNVPPLVVVFCDGPTDEHLWDAVHTYRQLDNAFGLNVVMIVDQTVTLLVRRSDGTHATNKSQFDAQCAQLSRATFGAPLFFASIDDSPIVNSVARDYNHGGGGIVDISRRWSNLTDAVASQIALRHWSLLDDTPCFISIEFAQAALHPDVRHWSLFGVDACVKKDDMRTVYLCTNRTFATVLLMMRENDMAHFRAWLEHLITGEENNNPLVRLQQQARRVAALNLFMRQPRYAEVMGRAVFKDRVGNALRARALAVHGDLFEEKVFELRNESILVGDGDHARVLRLLEDCLGDARIREIVRITPPTPLSEAAYSVTEHEFTQPKSN